jgi:hypothetical protein
MALSRTAEIHQGAVAVEERRRGSTQALDAFVENVAAHERGKHRTVTDLRRPFFEVRGLGPGSR